MLSSISWSSYLEILGISFLAYYVIIGLQYRRDIVAVVTGYQSKKVEPFHAGQLQQPTIVHDNERYQPRPDQPMGLAFLAQAAADEVDAYLQEARHEDFDKVDLSNGLRTILSKYPTLKGSNYQQQTETFIIQAAAHHCAIRLEGHEAAGLWGSGKA